MFLESENHWIVIDTPDSQQSLNFITAQGFDYFWWYTNTPLADSLSVSPLWVKVPSNKVEEILTRFSSSAVFASQLNDEQFEDYIKTLVLMLSPTHKPYVVRFYNPKYLQYWFADLTTERQETLLGPIIRIGWKQNGAVHTIENHHPSSFENSKTIAWFQLNEVEWDLLKIAYKK
ncbi:MULTISPECIES: DUF4123 domain-containing protein [Photobacterium]|uniref:DUF4123 domain-containing protein n=1 Tax=Photobacterium TaxID=657 RepID=UPI0005E48414|nr:MULTISPECIES: DUF4123 domain-containing protein [Photobacterium]KJG15334.1 hypothetical protein UA33_20135 [Photobacterium angustum]KJG20143.1 hypothetical protein UA39_20445 [Photobacterium angustum]KJG26995.1 hypothetical protein UA36_21035 [Photobacterium angustum]PSV23096.1 DUF4123 domain-containing protein [Photobacterium sp. GB-56]PSV32153.1 DUF4123 domain-containing protein [Photobacterium sp. GB-210]